MFNLFLNRQADAYGVVLLKLHKKLDQREIQYYLKTCQSHLGYEDVYKSGTAIGLGLTNHFPIIRAKQLMEVELQRDETCGRYNDSFGLINPGAKSCLFISQAFK